MEYEIINKNTALDYELCDALGERASDFLVLYLDGAVMEGLTLKVCNPHPKNV